MNLWIKNDFLTIKKVFTTIRLVWVSGGSELKPQNGQFQAF